MPIPVPVFICLSTAACTSFWSHSAAMRKTLSVSVRELSFLRATLAARACAHGSPPLWYSGMSRTRASNQPSEIALARKSSRSRPWQLAWWHFQTKPPVSVTPAFMTKLALSLLSPELVWNSSNGHSTTSPSILTQLHRERHVVRRDDLRFAQAQHLVADGDADAPSSEFPARRKRQTAGSGSENRPPGDWPIQPSLPARAWVSLS